MKKTLYFLITLFVIAGCKTTPPTKKLTAYKGMYDERPLSLLIMPPINKSTNVEAKEYFHSTLLVPLASRGFYVIPPFLSMEILKKESAYDSEQFIEAPLAKFGEVFGADMVLFTTITKWDKSAIGSFVMVGIEYVIKSTHTNEILYQRKGEIVYDTSVRSNSGGMGGVFANMIASAINTAATNYSKVARICNNYTLSDLPQGKYGPKFIADSAEFAGKPVFKATIRK